MATRKRRQFDGSTGLSDFDKRTHGSLVPTETRHALNTELGSKFFHGDMPNLGDLHGQGPKGRCLNGVYSGHIFVSYVWALGSGKRNGTKGGSENSLIAFMTES
jgi:hypothetical protein